LAEKSALYYDHEPPLRVAPSPAEGDVNDTIENLSENIVTYGIVYDVPPDLVQETLEVLDFREKEGYARDVCEVAEKGSQNYHKALLYRGMPDNPVFLSRAILDLPLSAAIMSVSVGPSGANDVYLNNLAEFLQQTGSPTQNDDTETLAHMVRSFQKYYQLYFLSGGGSNQHNQLLLNRPKIGSLVAAKDPHVRTDIVLPTSRCSEEATERFSSSLESDNGPVSVFAGGGHSGLLTKNGQLFLWGWNKELQCGEQSVVNLDNPRDQPLPFIKPLKNIVVEKAALGFSHTLVVEKHTAKLYAFGNDERGQVTGRRNVPIHEIAQAPVTPEFLKNDEIDIVEAGLFHSAVITKRGQLITFGCDRFGQSNPSKEEMEFQGSSDQPKSCAHSRWKPIDADRVVDVACGRRHTVVVDSLNRIWTFGENKHGQLGRRTKAKKDPTPSIVNMEGKIRKHDIVTVCSGWSHTILHAVGPDGNRLYGFGRNDKGQLGNESNLQVDLPIEIFSDKKVRSVQCGSESTMVIDGEGKCQVYGEIERYFHCSRSQGLLHFSVSGQIWGCGWNEHGNLGIGSQEDSFTLSPTQGVKISIQPGIKNPEVSFAVGGAHYIVGAVEI